MKSPIRLYDRDPILREVASEVDLEVQAKELKKLVNLMTIQTRLVNGYGVAANQLGYSMRVFSYLDGKRTRIVVNPRIVEYSDETWNFEEGCLSIPGYWWWIERPEKVLLKGLTVKGEEVEVEADGLLARIFQHEIDHLNGVLIIDKLDPDQKEEFLKNGRRS
jgi:peptide deformylase